MPLKLLSPKPATPAQQEVMSAPVALMDTEMAPAHRTPIKDIHDKSLSGQALESTRPSVDLDTLDDLMKPAAKSGTPVFADQAAADEALTATQPLSFNQAFRKARNRGKTTFKHNGAKFNTRQKDESDADWEEVLKNQTGPLLTDFIAGFERERAVSEIPAAKKMELLPQPEPLAVKNTRTAPTFKQMEIMQAPVKTKATHAASPRIVTDELNAKREEEGLRPLTMTSGYRDAQQNADAMMKNVEAAGSIEQARANGYTGKHYQKVLKDYYADPTRANLEAIGYVRMEREKVISGGHAGGDSADYSVKDLTNRADAVKRVAWLKSQGYKARLENWSGKNKGRNAHIHIDGIKH